MNVLFCTTSCVSEEKGGTERITARIAIGLQKLGYGCYSAYKNEISFDYPKAKFKGAYNVNDYPLNKIVLDKDINVVIVQKMTRDIIDLRKFLIENNIKCRIFSVLHFNPGYEEQTLRFSDFLSGLSLKKTNREKWKDLLRVLCYPIYKVIYPLRNKQLYRVVYKYSDKVILLSVSFVEEYRHYAHIEDNSKFVVIPNALSYDSFLSIRDFDSKKKQVLIVSRLSETQKRISTALKIWKQIELAPTFNDWTLKIVGHGEDICLYKKMVSDMNLKRVLFCGRQNPKKYYMESRIFMMTSAYEGWGLTLTEAQQFGCVPLAFDTFSSLSDIIDDGKSGFIVHRNDIKGYVGKIKMLLKNVEMQKKMSLCAILSSNRYTLSKVILNWDKLLKNNL